MVQVLVYRQEARVVVEQIEQITAHCDDRCGRRGGDVQRPEKMQSRGLEHVAERLQRSARAVRLVAGNGAGHCERIAIELVGE